MDQEVKYRDAITGEYVSKEYAEANPNTTVKEVDAQHIEAEPYDEADRLQGDDVPEWYDDGINVGDVANSAEPEEETS